MSFASETKNEISRSVSPRICCNKAEVCGLIKSCGSIMLSGKGNLGIKLVTENAAVARHIKTLILETFSVKSSLRMLAPGFHRKTHAYELKINDSRAAEKILRETEILKVTTQGKTLSGDLPEWIFRKKCCRKATLRGLFLGAGTMTDPSKEYLLEINLSKQSSAVACRKLFASFTDISAKMRERRGTNVVYIKDSEQIKDILNIMGAHRSLLDFENIRIGKDLRNQTNRISNFDNANIGRQSSAADKQLEDIDIIEYNVGLEVLSDTLIDTALTRKFHPDASLAELGELMMPKVSKAAVSARMKKISEKAETIRSGTEATEMR
jgi:DNA-binding protein WhiA